MSKRENEIQSISETLTTLHGQIVRIKEELFAMTYSEDIVKKEKREQQPKAWPRL